MYLNAELLPAEKALVSVFDHGFSYGDGLFETILVVGRHPVFLAAHLERLAAGARILRLELPWSGEQLAAAVQETVAAAALGSGYLRLTVTRGAGEGWRLAACREPTLLIVPYDHIPYPAEDYAQGFAAAISRWRRNHHSPLAQVKSLNYLENILAKDEALALGAQEAILLNLEGRVAEGAMSNVFVIGDGYLVTPPPQEGPLPGITRRYVLELASRVGLTAAERPVAPGELVGAPEAFLTSSLMGIMPLTFLEGRPVGTGRPGPLTRRLARVYQEAIGSEGGW
ncbi:MAG: hypothetical protein D9V47_08115 [Clostridia bacterium]|nr:MAG: hypothetical protein D9V47_08115 [Clostridia bacterium]